MATRGLVECRTCHKKINRDKEIENVDWFMKSRNHFYHCKCYNDWKQKISDVNSELSDEDWFNAVKEFFSKDLKIVVDYAKLTSQWKNFIKSGHTAKGIYFTLKYFYEVKHGDVDKSKGGIGIATYVYNEACAYWVDRQSREKDIISKIERQVQERLNQNKITLYAKEQKKKLKFSLDDIGEEFDE